MPRIPLPTKRNWRDYPRYTKQSKLNNMDYKWIYNTRQWRELRLTKLMRDPLCEECLLKGVIASAIDVHHVNEISNGTTKMEKQAIGFNINNLESLCKDCHKKKHML